MNNNYYNTIVGSNYRLSGLSNAPTTDWNPAYIHTVSKFHMKNGLLAVSANLLLKSRSQDSGTWLGRSSSWPRPAVSATLWSLLDSAAVPSGSPPGYAPPGRCCGKPCSLQQTKKKKSIAVQHLTLVALGCGLRNRHIRSLFVLTNSTLQPTNEWSQCSVFASPPPLFFPPPATLVVDHRSISWEQNTTPALERCSLDRDSMHSLQPD